MLVGLIMVLVLLGAAGMILPVLGIIAVGLLRIGCGALFYMVLFQQDFR